MSLTRDQAIDAVIQIHNLLATRAFDAIEKRTNGTRLSATAIEHAVNEYGRKVGPVPSSARDEANLVRLNNDTAWSIVLPVWMVSEGRSDLSICATVHDDGRLELDDLHVL